MAQQKKTKKVQLANQKRRRMMLAGFVGVFGLIGMYLSFNALNQAAPSNQILIRARGDQGTENMELRIDGRTVASWKNISRSPSAYTYTAPSTTTINDLKVHFTNDGGSPTADKNLRIDYVEVGSRRYQSEDGNVRSSGAWSRSNGCGEGNKNTDTLHCNGWLQYPVPSGTTIGSSGGVAIAVRARGQTGKENVELHVRGSRVASWRLTRSDQTYNYRHGSNVGNTDIRVVFTNDLHQPGVKDRNAIIDYIKVNGSTFQTEASNTRSTGSWTRSTGCAAGNKRVEKLNCNGYFEYAIGASGGISTDGGSGGDSGSSGNENNQQNDSQTKERP